MEHEMGSSYGLWSLVILNSAIFIIFAFSFFKPRTKRDWRSFSAFSAFVVALFVEMYGFPLTIYLLSGWLASRYPGVDFLAHENGHLWHTIFGFDGDAHSDPMHIASFVFIGGGFWILSAAWNVLYKAQRVGKMAVTGLYEKVRHPQYIGFIAIMFGFLLQWPTIPTLILFPILTYMYIRLAKKEEQDSSERFGIAWADYSARVPAFIPKFSSSSTAQKGEK
ncbi:MAG: isoprenylcysteine carboxylmethyltransferase family protein [Pseudomonadota bacterium]|nr:isoprenylcysteine carboxylmethyltransferase family protein [Pseudomonadota bacterium]QKK04266.1 MAG: isoprenylcysteine carboxylmethyltransferase family protein [Pseudomonadota bacterium]